MRLEATRSGGFAGLSRRAAIETAELAPEEAASLREQVGELDLDDLARRSPMRGSGADRFQYDLTVTEEGWSRHVRASEAAAPPALRRLVDRVLAGSGVAETPES